MIKKNLSAQQFQSWKVDDWQRLHLFLKKKKNIVIFIKVNVVYLIRWYGISKRADSARCCSRSWTLDRMWLFFKQDSYARTWFNPSFLFIPCILTFVFLLSRWLVNPNIMSESTMMVPRSMTLGLGFPAPGDPDEFGKAMWAARVPYTIIHSLRKLSESYIHVTGLYISRAFQQ